MIDKSLRKPIIKGDAIERWQSIVDCLAEIMQVPACLVMKLDDDELSVFVKNESLGNPYSVGHSEKYSDSGLYCETVIRTGTPLFVPNALEDERWAKNPDVKLNMINYLGYPVAWPNGDVFGTLCVLDIETHHYSRLQTQTMLQFKTVIEDSLEILWGNDQLRIAEAVLTQQRDHLEELVAARTSELERSRDAAEAGNRAKTIFLANMSHELRKRMVRVLGMIGLASTNAADPKQIGWLNRCKFSADRMVEVVGDIIDFSKIESERLPLEEKNFSLTQIIDDAMAMQDPIAETKGLILTREIPATFPEQLSGDAFRLRQILLNFLDNACKFSDRGMITVRVSAVEQDGNSVLTRIEVEDQGIGISPEQQAILFQAFTQLDGSMARKYGGAGLGLIFSKRLANLMGGDVGMASQQGRGSTFWATVPLQRFKTSEVGI